MERSLERLRKITLAEVACRSRQGASKLIDRVRPAPIRWQTPDEFFRREAPAMAAADAVEGFRSAAADRFFAGATEPDVVAVLDARSPEIRRGLATAADAICRRRFDLLGHRDLSFGDPVDWHFDPIANRRVPLIHWSQINPLNSAMVGDSKVIWELNRHQWLITLALAYRVIGHERYLHTAAELLESWLEANPRGLGINWTSSLEVSYRLISWCWTMVVLRNTRLMQGARFARIAAAVWEHAAHIERYLSYYFSPNTHLTGEALGLVYAGILFPEFRDAARWRDLGAKILIDESRRQILPDGVYVEQATHYHRYTLEIYLQFLILAKRARISVPAEVTERVQRMFDSIISMSRANASLPEIGDADGGSALPLVRRTPDDCRGVCALGAALFARPDLAWASGGFAAEVWWLLGGEGVSHFDRLAPAPPAAAASRLFPQGGYAVMRSGWDRDALQMIVDAGPLGCPVSGAHGHADLLSLHCSAFGEEFLADAGTYCYTPESEWRQFFRSSRAHSTVLVDGLEQAEPMGPFSWAVRPAARVRDWRSTADFDLVDADHDAYAHLLSPVRHRRRVLFVKPHYWVVVDDLEGDDEHAVEIRFQLAPRPVTTRHGWVWLPAKQSGMWLGTFSTAALNCNVVQGEEAPIQGWRSMAYGQKRPAPVVIYSTRARLPQRFVTIVLPTRDAAAAPPRLEIRRGIDNHINQIAIAGFGHAISIASDMLTVEELACAAS